MSKKKSDVISVIAIIVSYLLSGAVFVYFFDSWSVRVILATITSFGVYLLNREIIKKKFPSVYEEVEIDEKDERNMMLRYQATYYGFYIGLVILMIIGSLLYDVGHTQLQAGVMISLSILIITQVIGRVFVQYKNRS